MSAPAGFSGKTRKTVAVSSGHRKGCGCLCSLGGAHPRPLRLVRQSRLSSIEDPLPPPTGNDSLRRPLAYREEAFLQSPESRPLRFLSEYLWPLAHFNEEKIHDTIVFFGSA